MLNWPDAVAVVGVALSLALAFASVMFRRSK